MVTHRKGRMKAEAMVEATTSATMGSSSCILARAAVGGGITPVLLVCVVWLIDRVSLSVRHKRAAVFRHGGNDLAVAPAAVVRHTKQSPGIKLIGRGVAKSTPLSSSLKPGARRLRASKRSAAVVRRAERWHARQRTHDFSPSQWQALK